MLEVSWIIKLRNGSSRSLCQRHPSGIKNTIVNRISEDFNLTPLLAEAYFNQIKGYFLEHGDIALQSGQIKYLAIDDREPAGKPVDLCKKLSVKLTIHNADEDTELYKRSGLSGLRRHKLLRITKEAIEQGALLSYEDIAFMLTTSVVTIKRDMAQMRREGLTIPTRGDGDTTWAEAQPTKHRYSTSI